MARARRAGVELPAPDGRRGAHRGVRGRDADGGRRGARGRLQARADREVARLRLRRALGGRARAGRPARRLGEDRPGGRSDKAKIASPEQVERATGFVAGAVAPFPLPAVDRVFVDRNLLSHKQVWIGAGSPRHMAVIAPGDLVRLARAQSHGRCRTRHVTFGYLASGPKEARGARDREDLDERRARRLGRCDGSRRHARAPLRHGCVRGHPLLRDREGPGRVQADRPSRAPEQLREAPLPRPARTPSTISMPRAWT